MLRVPLRMPSRPSRLGDTITYIGDDSTELRDGIKLPALRSSYERDRPPPSHGRDGAAGPGAAPRRPPGRLRPGQPHPWPDRPAGRAAVRRDGARGRRRPGPGAALRPLERELPG